MTNYEQFLTVYAEEIERAMRRRPDDYGVDPAKTDIPSESRARATKIVTALAKGSAVCASDTLRRAAKRVGLADTKQTTIYLFIRDSRERESEHAPSVG